MRPSVALCLIGLLVWKNPRTSEHPFSGVSRVGAPSPSWRSHWWPCAGHGHGRLSGQWRTTASSRLPSWALVLYRAIHTSTIFFLGVAGLNASATSAISSAVGSHDRLTLVLMAITSAPRCTACSSSSVMLGANLGSISFMQHSSRLPSSTCLTARLFGSIANSAEGVLPDRRSTRCGRRSPLVLMTRRLSVLSLGRETA